MKAILGLAIFYWILAVSIATSHERDQLTLANINQARIYFQDKLNNGLPFGGSSIDFKIPSGELVSNEEIRMLAKWLQLKNSLPSLKELDSLLDSKNTATRIFCFESLKIAFKEQIDFNPYFSPKAQEDKIAKIRLIIQASIRNNLGEK